MNARANRPCVSRLSVLCVALLTLTLAACGGESLRSRIDSVITRLDAAVVRLGDELDRGQLRNAELIRQYADQVRSARPEMRELVDVLAREGTRQGTLYSTLKTRLDDVRAALPDPGARDEAYVATVDELNSLAGAVDPGEFNRALADPLNVLADLSDGALPRVDAISASASQRANGATDLGPGSQLVGNPHYGQWRANSSGTSFWVWYGQFALMRSLIGGRASATAPGRAAATTATTTTTAAATTPLPRPANVKPRWTPPRGANSHPKAERSAAPMRDSGRAPQAAWRGRSLPRPARVRAPA